MYQPKFKVGQVLSNSNGVKVTCTKVAEEPGVYKPTSLDELKKTVDFRITYCYGSKFNIEWNATGKTEFINTRRLNQLKKLHTWTTDF